MYSGFIPTLYIICPFSLYTVLVYTSYQTVRVFFFFLSKGNRPADRSEKLPLVLFFSFGIASLFFQGPLVQKVSHPQVYRAGPLSILQQGIKLHHIKTNKSENIVIQMCVYLIGVQTLIFSNGNLWHGASGIFSTEGTFGLAWTLTGTVSLADHEPTNSLKRISYYFVSKESIYYEKKYHFHYHHGGFEAYWVWGYCSINCPEHSEWMLRNTRYSPLSMWGLEMTVLCHNIGHVLHHFTLQGSRHLQSGALPGRYGFLFLFLPPSAPLESSSAGSRSKLESDFASQSRSSTSARERDSIDEWRPCGREHPSQAPQHNTRVNSIWTALTSMTLAWLKLSSPGLHFQFYVVNILWINKAQTNYVTTN